jgi:hypothetical protein
MSEPTQEFEQAAAGPPDSLWAEYLYFLRHNKKWWLLPILLVFGLLGGLVMASGSGLLPWIYALF